MSYLGQASVNPETNNEQQLPPPTEIKVKFANVLRFVLTDTLWVENSMYCELAEKILHNV